MPTARCASRTRGTPACTWSPITSAPIAASAYSPATGSGAPNRRIDTRGECAGSTTTDYETATARTMFGLASRSYDIEPVTPPPQKRLDELGSGTVHFPDQMLCWELVAALRGSQGIAGLLTDTEVIVARNVKTKDLAVSFRGTEFTDVFDVLTDLSAVRVPWTLPDGTRLSHAVHSGFAVAYSSVRDELLAVLAGAVRPDVPDARVYFTGHSLGGALATLASIDLVDDLTARGYSSDEVVTYTFGAPRSMSLEMANRYRSFVPVSYAVANGADPVPLLPPVDSTSNPYSHIPGMIVLHGADGDARIRTDRGDGRDFRGCLALGIGKVTHHFRPEYHRRIGATNFVGTPDAYITIAGGQNRLHWDSPLPGPCDWVGLFRTSGTLTSSVNPLSDRYIINDDNGYHTTLVGKGDDYWAGYVNRFGELIAAREYFAATPSVSLRRNENIIGGDTIDFVWSVSDPGDHDLVVLYDRDPWTAGPNGWYVSIVGRVEAKADTASPERTQIRVGSDPNKWWVAYVMVDDSGRQRILAVSRGVRG